MFISLRARRVPSFLSLPLDNTLHAILTTAIVVTILAPAYAEEPDWNKGGALTVSHSIDSSQDITLQNQLNLSVNADQSVIWRGNVGTAEASPGLFALIKSGDGRLELWGNNTGIMKPVSLREGTLHLAGRHALSDLRQLEIYTGTTLSYEADAIVGTSLELVDTVSGTPGHDQDPAAIQWRVNRGIATQIGDIQGSVPLIKLGAGTLRLSAPAMHVDGLLTIAEGTVDLRDEFWGHIRVLDTATLSGGGSAGWVTVGSGGALTPNDQLTVSNDLRFLPGSRFHIRAWPDGGNDSVYVVRGSAELDGHVFVLPQGGAEDWQKGIDTVIVQTGDGLVTGRFASVESALPYLEPKLSYDSHHVTLHLRPRASGTLPLTKSQQTSWAASVRSMMSEDSRFIRDAVYTHGTVRSGFWSHAFHSSGDRGARGAVKGDERRINGLLLGVNLDLTSGWRLGVYAGGSNTHAEERSATLTGGTSSHIAASVNANANANIDSAHVGLLAHHTTNRDSQVTAGVAHSWHRIRSHRTASSPFHDALSSRYRARTTQLFARVQHPLWTSSDQHTTIEPFVGMAWAQTQQGNYTESGGPLALQSPSDRSAVLYSSLGSTINHRLNLPQGDATLTGSVAWRHASGDTDSGLRQHFRDDVHQTTFTTYGLPVAQQAWQLRLGVQAEVTKHSQLGVYYAGQHGHGYHDHGVQLALSVRW